MLWECSKDIGVDLRGLVYVVWLTFLEELPRANSMAFLFLFFGKGFSFSLPLLLARVGGLEDGGDKNSLVNLDISIVIKAWLVACANINVQKSRKGDVIYLLILLLLLPQTQARVHHPHSGLRT